MHGAAGGDGGGIAGADCGGGSRAAAGDGGDAGVGGAALVANCLMVDAAAANAHARNNDGVAGPTHRIPWVGEFYDGPTGEFGLIDHVVASERLLLVLAVVVALSPTYFLCASSRAFRINAGNNKIKSKIQPNEENSGLREF